MGCEGEGDGDGGSGGGGGGGGGDDGDGSDGGGAEGSSGGGDDGEDSAKAETVMDVKEVKVKMMVAMGGGWAELPRPTLSHELHCVRPRHQ